MATKRADPLMSRGARMERADRAKHLERMVKKHMPPRPRDLSILTPVEEAVEAAKRRIFEDFYTYQRGRVARYNRKPGGLGT